MADSVDIRIRLQGAQKFVTDSAKSAAALHGIGRASDDASRSARTMGAAVSGAANTSSRALGAVAAQARFLAIGFGAAGAAGVAMGLKYNAQIESSRLRFGLFTNDVDALTKAVQKIDMNSAFGFGDLSDAAALFGNSGIKDIPPVLQAAANAAAASGKGVEGFKSIAIALSQIASKGRLSQEEINQLNEAGAPGAQRIIADHFQLTAKELQNLGGQGLDAKEAIEALTREWTSGKMAKAAQDQTRTLGGQWQMLTGNVQKLSGAATESLAAGLRETWLPAVNKATQEITEIFGREGLSNERKIAEARRIIIREIGPVWHELADEISEADIPGKLGNAIAAATPKVLNAMADIAPKAAKAFVDGWLHSGPEAQLITALFLGNKLRKSDFGQALFSKGSSGGRGGAASTLLGGRGATPANPVFVAVVGGDGLPGGGVAGKGGRVGSVARNGLRVAGPVGAAVVGAEVLDAVLPANVKRAINQDLPSRAGGGSVRQQAASAIPAPGFGNTAITLINKIGDKEISRATVVTDMIEQRRAAAVHRASG